MKKNRKLLILSGLLVLCTVLTAGWFMLRQIPQGGDAPPSADVSVAEPPSGSITETNGPGVNPGVIADTTTATNGTAAPVVNPSGIAPNGSTTGGQSGSDIPLTVINDKPAPPELPDTAPKDSGMDGETWDALDPALKDPDVTPDITHAPVEPDKPADNAPQPGDRNGSGEIYIPGFGWVKDEGGGGSGENSWLDPEHSDFDKIIGH